MKQATLTNAARAQFPAHVGIVFPHTLSVAFRASSPGFHANTDDPPNYRSADSIPIVEVDRRQGLSGLFESCTRNAVLTSRRSEHYRKPKRGLLCRPFRDLVLLLACPALTCRALDFSVPFDKLRAGSTGLVALLR